MPELTESDIKDRLREVVDLIDRHELALAYLNQDRQELEAGVRAFDRVRIRRDYSAGLLPELPVPVDANPAQTKPANIPTVPDMIVEALMDGISKGKPALSPREFLAYIRKEYWPEAQGTSVGPIAWRMWSKEHRLHKENGLYSLTPGDPALAASMHIEDEVI